MQCLPKYKSRVPGAMLPNLKPSALAVKLFTEVLKILIN